MPIICRFYGIVIKMYFQEWATEHQQELQEIWNTQVFTTLKPLE